MTLTSSKLCQILLICIQFILITSCVTTASYNPIAHQYAVDTKVEVLAIVAKSDHWQYVNAQEHIQKIDKLGVKSIEFVKSLQHNDPTVAQWLSAMGPQQSLWSDFIKFWAKQGTLKTRVCQHTAKEFTSAFDSIIRSETGKAGGTQ